MSFPIALPFFPLFPFFPFAPFVSFVPGFPRLRPGRRRLQRACAALGFALFALSCAHAAPALPPTSDDDDSFTAAALSESTDRLVVEYRAGTLGARAAELADVPRTHAAAHLRGLQMRALRRTAFGAQVLQLDHALTLAEARSLARAIEAGDPTVARVEVDRRLHAAAVPLDPLYASQWHLYEPLGGIDAPAAWLHSTGAGVVVAVIDSGVRPHADLAANLLPGYDFISTTRFSADGTGRDGDASDPGDWSAAGQCAPGAPAEPSSWHGTHVAGLVAARAGDARGVVGVAYDARVLPVRVLGRCGGYASDIADAIMWSAGGVVPGVPANAHPAAVLNLSLGGSGACPASMQWAIDRVRAAGRLVVVAAGNGHGAVHDSSPANCRGVLVVAATDRRGAAAPYTNTGPEVALAAPGGRMIAARDPSGILSTFNDGRTTPGLDSYAEDQGTSMAAPQVAGVAALMLARDPTLSADEITALLKGGARRFPGRCTGCGAGLLDAGRAVASVPWQGLVPRVVRGTPAESNKLGAVVLAGLPVKVRATLATAGAVARFRVSVPAGRTLRLRLLPDAHDGGSLEVLDAAGRAQALTASGIGLPVTASVANRGPAASTYTIQVRRLARDASASGDYSLEAAASY
jgi:serine protease